MAQPPGGVFPPRVEDKVPTREEEDDEEDDDEEEEEEPKLKYQRLGSSVSEGLKKDVASCFATHEKFLALGTHWGLVFILDLNGNEIRRLTHHNAPVNEICIEETDLGSCSDDGKVVLSSLYTNNETSEHVYHRPITSLALDPNFHRKKTRQFACGGKAGQLILNQKGWFGTKDTTVHSGEGAIHAVKWRSNYIAWANDVGVKIFDTSLGQRITYIDRPQGSPRADQYRPNLCWENDTTLLIGWADMIKIGVIREKQTNTGQVVRFVEIVAFFQFKDIFVSGIAPFGEWLVVLAYILEPDEYQVGKMNPQRPELRILSRTNEEICSDALTINGFENGKPGDYALYKMPHESLFYILAPKDVVVAKPRDLDDHISWLLERKLYEEALAAAEQNEGQMKDHQLVDIGEKYIGHLLETEETDKAAALCPKVLGRNSKLWERWIFKFAQAKKLKAISPYIPIKNPQLNERVYEMVLNSFLIDDYQGLLRTITEWPHTIYNIQNIITAVLVKLKQGTDTPLLMDCLAQLYTYDKQFDKTLHIYLRLKRGNVFELIQKHDLFDSIQDKILLLLNFDQQEAIKLLVSNTNRIPMSVVVGQLKDKNPQLLHLYLHAIFVKDSHLGEAFHDMQVELYADYDRKLLLPFLHQSTAYQLEKAFKICEQKSLYPEMVHILGRMGNTKQALSLLIEKIGDVKQAIEFVQTHHDDELWEDLISHSMKNPVFVAGLLENIGGHVDPIKLINRIPKGMKIPGLRDRLVKIISDYNLQMSLREGCNLILRADCVDLSERLVKGHKRALRVECATCATCGAEIEAVKTVGEGLAGFFCGHYYHVRCLREAIRHHQSTGQGPLAPAQREKQREAELLGQKSFSSAASDDRIWCILCHNPAERRRVDE